MTSIIHHSTNMLDQSFFFFFFSTLHQHHCGFWLLHSWKKKFTCWQPREEWKLVPTQPLLVHQGLFSLEFSKFLSLCKSPTLRVVGVGSARSYRLFEGIRFFLVEKKQVESNKWQWMKVWPSIAKPKNELTSVPKAIPMRGNWTSFWWEMPCNLSHLKSVKVYWGTHYWEYGIFNKQKSVTNFLVKKKKKMKQSLWHIHQICHDVDEDVMPMKLRY